MSILTNRTPTRLRFATVGAALLLALSYSGHVKAQTRKTLYNFCSQPQCADGTGGSSGLLRDNVGNLFGSTYRGGPGSDPIICPEAEGGCGVIYELRKVATNSRSSYQVLYSFCQKAKCTDGSLPNGNLIADASGNLYGTTHDGGKHDGGTVFELIHGDNGHWSLKVLHSFCFYTENCTDGSNPRSGLTYAGESFGVPYDGASPLYGTAYNGGGSRFAGTVYSLTLKSGHWKYSVLHTFDLSHGGNPVGGLFVDSDGKIFGTTQQGGNGKFGFFGTAFQMIPTGTGGYTYDVIYNFCSKKNCADGSDPEAALIPDGNGNLYGVTRTGGTKASGCSTGCGVIYELNPGARAYSESVLHAFCAWDDCKDGFDPFGKLARDSAGNLLGVTGSGGGNDIGNYKYGAGVVYRLGQEFNVLYSFCAEQNCVDGAGPHGVVIDEQNHLFGTTADGGKYFHFGTIFELIP